MFALCVLVFNILSASLNHTEKRSLATNVALNKTARQSSTYKAKDEYSAYKAVNGILNDFSLTADRNIHRWWKVDLITLRIIYWIVLYNKDGFCKC